MFDTFDQILILHIKILGYLTVSHRTQLRQETIRHAHEPKTYQ